MAVTDNLVAAQANIDRAVADALAGIKELLAKLNTAISGGASQADLQPIADDLNARAAALEAAINPPAAPAV